MRTRVLGGLVVLLAAWLGPLAEFAWADLHYADFSSAGGLNLVGDAAVVGDRLRLTPLIYYPRGAAWFTEKQNVAGPFEVVFRFQVPQLVGLGSDGFAFVIQNSDPYAIGDIGGNIAYGGDQRPSISNSLAIEFDLFSNREWNDPAEGLNRWDTHHVAVQTGGIGPNSASHSPSAGFMRGLADLPDFSDGAVHTAKVTYVPGTLAIFYDDAAQPCLTIPVDIANTLALSDGYAFVGFTAASGDHMEVHDILEFNMVPAPGAAVLGLIGLAAIPWVRRLRA